MLPSLLTTMNQHPREETETETDFAARVLLGLDALPDDTWTGEIDELVRKWADGRLAACNAEKNGTPDIDGVPGPDDIKAAKAARRKAQMSGKHSVERQQGDALSSFGRFLCKLAILPSPDEFRRAAVLHSFLVFGTFLAEHVELSGEREIIEKTDGMPETVVAVHDEREPGLSVSAIYAAFEQVCGFDIASSNSSGQLADMVEQHLRSLGLRAFQSVRLDGEEGWRGAKLKGIPEKPAVLELGAVSAAAGRVHLSAKAKVSLLKQRDAADKKVEVSPKVPARRRLRQPVPTTVGKDITTT